MCTTKCNVETLCTLATHCVCVLYDSHNVFFLEMVLVVFIMDMNCVLCETDGSSVCAVDEGYYSKD